MSTKGQQIYANYAKRWKQMKKTLYHKGTSIRQVPEFGTSKHYGKAHGISSGWMIYNDTVWLLAYYIQQYFHIWSQLFC